MEILGKTLLKGGSLAGTYLVDSSEGQFVRKEISLDSDREYGFQRWYSQLKRLQRYDTLFPDLFPKVIRFGSNGKQGYFDIEYFPDAINCFDYLKNFSSESKEIRIFDLIIEGMKILHSIKIKSCSDAINLYHREEVTQKLEDCWGNTEFFNYANSSSVVFEGHEVPSLISMLPEYEDFGATNYKKLSHVEESYTHGNITLENILYCPNTDRIVFVDPYEENIIDNKYNEYSQLLQSCSSYYEVYNESDFDSNEKIIIPEGIKIFKIQFENFLDKNLSPKELKVVKYFEASQFIRMLPFKVKVNPAKAFFFYNLASYLVYNLISQ